MPYQLSWYRKDHIVHAEFSGNFTLEELEAYGRELTTDYLEKATSPIHLISDANALDKFPTQALPAIRSSEGWLRHANLGWVFLIGKKTNPMLGFLLAVVTKVVKLKYKMVTTPEDALAILRNLDPTLLTLES